MSKQDRLTPAEVMAQLRRIELGYVSINPGEDPAKVYAGDVKYYCSNGWTVTVFNDCDSWDYLDSAQSPDGRYWDFEYGVEDRDVDQWDEPSRYRPSTAVARKIYGINE